MTGDSDDAQRNSPGHSMWGGRFYAKPAALMRRINASIGFDRRLAAEDIAGSRAHAAMLAAQGIISKEDARAIDRGLTEIGEEIAAGRFTFKEELEDIHMNIEARLSDLIGEAAGRLHTARSRNDQVALDLRLWVRAACERAGTAIAGLQRALLAKAEENAETLMPGFTHLQSAQPITFGHHLMAHVEMLGRDASRFADAAVRMDECPLGAAALAGTAFRIDREATARALGFSRPTANSLDSVSDRDFALEAVSAANLLALHLSRLAEEFVLWTSPGFAFGSFSDAFSTGSSIMPQKRNPDAAELVRAKAGTVLAALVNLSMVMKGLPLGYAKDLQEDKVPVFSAFDDIELALAASAAMVADFTPDKKAMAAAAGAGHATATDLADFLVREGGLPFRKAHRLAGAAVKEAERRGIALADLPMEAFEAMEPHIGRDVVSVLAPAASVASRTSFGGTAPGAVREQIRRWKERLS